MSIQQSPEKGLSRGTRFGYGAGSVATGAFGTVPGLMLLPYLTDRLGTAALLAGAIVLLPKGLDVLLNPVAGRISDRTIDPRGPRRPWLLRGGLVLVIGFALLFAAPKMPLPAELAWVLVVFIATATGYAFFQVPFLSMPAEITSSYQERTRLMTLRVAIMAGTILVAGGVSPIIRDGMHDAYFGRLGYMVMGLVMAAIMLVGVLTVYHGTRNAPIHTVTAGSGGLMDQLRIVAGAPNFRRLLTTFVIQALATGTMLAGVNYMAGNILPKSAGTFLFVCFVAPAILLSSVWERIGARYGKTVSFTASSLILAVGALGTITALAGASAVGVVYAFTALAGVGYAGCQMFPIAMLPDIAAVDAKRTGSSRIGVYTGVWSAGETLGLALGPGLYSVVLWLGHYISSTTGGTTQPQSALTAIILGFGLVPAVLIVISLWWLRHYNLTAEAVAEAITTEKEPE